MLKLMFITNNPAEARIATEAGVDRIFVDLEFLGKEKRQQGRSTVISRHRLQDVSAIREHLPSAEILVRTNPMHDGSSTEVDQVVGRGADILMLPMFACRNEVQQFIDYVGGRARICLLLETPQAVACLPSILGLRDGFHEVHVGLNDLHLALGLHFMFEVVASGLVDAIARDVLEAGLRFGFGGVGRLGTGMVPAEWVLSEHVRIGSSMVILSRTFHESLNGNLATEIRNLRNEEYRLRRLSREELERNRVEFNRRVWRVADGD